MRDRFIARMQAALTFLLVLAFVVLLALWALGNETAGAAADKLKEFVSIAVIFWLMRHRPNGASEEPVASSPPTPITPP